MCHLCISNTVYKVVEKQKRNYQLYLTGQKQYSSTQFYTREELTMIFSSLEFIFIFLPIFLIIYFVSSKKYRNYILLIGSIIFYIVGAWGHLHYILLLALTILINYIIGKNLYKSKNRKLLVIGIIYNL